MKKISKRKLEEQKRLDSKAKKEKLLLAICSAPPFILTVTLIVLYACKITVLWLFAASACSWYALGALFTVAAVKKWGYVYVKNGKQERNSTTVTVYNIILIFALAVLFTVLFIKELL